MSEFETKAQNLLRKSEHKLDNGVAQQLASARRQVLNSHKRSRLPSFLLPATGMALASLIAVVLVYSPLENQRSIEDEALISEGIELYEDLDFYYWLASQESQLKS